ncbi:L,D-transpeptidase [Ruegeria arenilitoris]|uniref:L,D-transpeptidase n=1 Tax=Ruegeria arenilitoris TaxID=1173585 RepID=UPI00147CD475|nr:L,D-transpeptidase [Ruegeria arenilitoris]
MFTRRTFLATSATASLLPSLVNAKKATEYDPTPQFVRIKKEFQPGQLLVVPRSFYLYFVTEPRKAIRYGCGVGRAGLEFTGTATIDVKKEWPTWRPTEEMIEREPVTYAKFKDNDYVQPGGNDNPLGARALYLFQNGVDTYFRIHGTTQPQTIGRAASNGCIRMLNEHVIDLYARVPIGTVVTVV